MTYQPINFTDKLKLFSDQWAPRVIAEMNDYQFKLVRIQGEFVWHQHAWFNLNASYQIIPSGVQIGRCQRSPVFLPCCHSTYGH